jgi:hypothetical protein
MVPNTLPVELLLCRPENATWHFSVAPARSQAHMQPTLTNFLIRAGVPRKTSASSSGV